MIGLVTLPKVTERIPIIWHDETANSSYQNHDDTAPPPLKRRTHMDAMFFNIFTIDFFDRVLIS